MTTTTIGAALQDLRTRTGTVGSPTWAEVVTAVRSAQGRGARHIELPRFVCDPAQRLADGTPVLLEPTTLAVALLRSTVAVTVVVTIDPLTTEPYNAARYLAALEHFSPGRTRLVLAGPAAPTPEESARSDEFAAALRALWESFPASAVLADRETGQYFDPGTLRRDVFHGKHVTVRGALNLPTPTTPFAALLTGPTTTSGTSS